MTTPRLLVVKGFGGPAATVFAPVWSELAELAVVYERTESTFLDVDPVAEQQAVEACGDYLEVGDPAAVVPRALEYAADNPVDGVLTVSEPLLRPTAEIAARLGLRYHNSQDAARILTDKFEQREALRRHGMATPRHASLAAPDDLEPGLDAVGLPAVLKPAFGAGSMLIFRIDSKAELEAHYAEAMARRERSELLRGVSPRFDLEEVIESDNWHRDGRYGSYVSVETLMFGGEFHALAVSDRTRPLPPFRETGLMLPSRLPPDRRSELIDVARGATEAFGVTDGPLHIEVMMTPTGPCVIEVNGRLGGSIPYIFRQVSDVDLFREIAKIALGIAPNTAPEFDGHGGMFNVHVPAEGRVQRVRGIEEAEQIPGVRQLMVGVHAGDWVSNLLGLLGGMVRAICVAPTPDELLAIRDQVLATVQYDIDPA
ncbi:MAG: ATP-grasp domain-containing protein [Acidimicrobiia bacterium]